MEIDMLSWMADHELILLLAIILFALAYGATYVLEYRQTQATTPAEGKPVKRKPLNELSPAEIRAVAARYNFKVTGKAGNTWNRIGTYALCGFILFVIMLYAASYLLGWLPAWAWVGIALGAWTSLFFGLLTPLAFYVPVPQLTGVKAMNFFTGRVHIYMPGASIPFPWEVIVAEKEEDYESLRSDVISAETEFTSLDGVKVMFKNPSLRWRVFPPLLLLNASHSSGTIKLGATEIFKTTLSNEIIHTNIEVIRTAKKLKGIQEAVTKALEGKTKQHLDAHGSSFEEQYGVIAEIPALGPPELTKEYSDALEGKASMKINEEAADSLVARSKNSPAPIEFGQALNTVMINNEKGVKKDIFEIQMDHNTREAVGDLGKAAGPVIAGAAALAGKASAKPSSKGASK